MEQLVKEKASVSTVVFFFNTYIPSGMIRLRGKCERIFMCLKGSMSDPFLKIKGLGSKFAGGLSLSRNQSCQFHLQKPQTDTASV